MTLRRGHVRGTQWQGAGEVSHLPNDAADHDSLLATDAVCKNAGDECADEGSARHGGIDATLNVGCWASTHLLTGLIFFEVRSLVEVAEILLLGDDG